MGAPENDIGSFVSLRIVYDRVHAISTEGQNPAIEACDFLFLPIVLSLKCAADRGSRQMTAVLRKYGVFMSLYDPQSPWWLATSQFLWSVPLLLLGYSKSPHNKVGSSQK